MIGNRYLNASLLACSILFLSPTVMAGECDDYLMEVGAAEGVVPKFNEDNTLRALVIYADGNFLVPKRSLISKARRKATLKAKREFAEWVKTDLQSESVVVQMMEQEEVTDEQGNTSGKVTELEGQLDAVRSNTEAVLSGIVKLDECVDTEDNVVYVELGWKPSLTKAAGDAAVTIKEETERGEAPTSKKAKTENKTNTESASGSSETSESSETKVKKAKSYRVKSKAKDDF